MSMSPRDWNDMASVYQAGADVLRSYAMNVERQQQAESLEAMAMRCKELARQRNMTEEDLERVQRDERQAFVPDGSRVRCRKILDTGARPGLCQLHMDHVLDGTDHARRPDPGPAPWPGRS